MNTTSENNFAQELEIVHPLGSTVDLKNLKSHNISLFNIPENDKKPTKLHGIERYINVIYDFESLKKFMEFTFIMNAKFSKFKFSSDLKIDETLNIDNQKIIIVLTCVNTVVQYDFDYSNYIKEEVIEMIKGVNGKKKFKSTYGTHFVSTETYGGYYNLFLTLDKVSSSFKRNFKLKLGAGYSSFINNFRSDIGINNISDSTSIKSSFQIKEYNKGFNIDSLPKLIEIQSKSSNLNEFLSELASIYNNFTLINNGNGVLIKSDFSDLNKPYPELDEIQMDPIINDLEKLQKKYVYFRDYQIRGENLLNEGYLKENHRESLINLKNKYNNFKDEISKIHSKRLNDKSLTEEEKKYLINPEFNDLRNIENIIRIYEFGFQPIFKEEYQTNFEIITYLDIYNIDTDDLGYSYNHLFRGDEIIIKVNGKFKFSTDMTHRCAYFLILVSDREGNNINITLPFINKTIEDYQNGSDFICKDHLNDENKNNGYVEFINGEPNAECDFDFQNKGVNNKRKLNVGNSTTFIVKCGADIIIQEGFSIEIKLKNPDKFVSRNLRT